MKTFKEYCLLEYISPQNLKGVEKYADKIFGALGIDVGFTRHFRDRLNDKRDKKSIGRTELARIFQLVHKKYGKKISKMRSGAEAIIFDMETDVNIPFVIQVSDSGKMELVVKTIMRKKDFRSGGTTKFPVGTPATRHKRKVGWRAAPDDPSWKDRSTKISLKKRIRPPKKDRSKRVLKIT